MLYRIPVCQLLLIRMDEYENNKSSEYLQKEFGLEGDSDSLTAVCVCVCMCVCVCVCLSVFGDYSETLGSDFVTTTDFILNFHFSFCSFHLPH
jgi:hypothetical protein